MQRLRQCAGSPALLAFAIALVLLTSLAIFLSFAHSLQALATSDASTTSNASTINLQSHSQSVVVTGTLIFTKTVGAIPNVCSSSNTIDVQSGSDVYFCYQVENQTDKTLNFHRLVDSNLPEQNISSNYILAPGAITTTIQGPINITQGISGVDAEAQWIATGGGETFSPKSSAEVFVEEPGIQISAFLIPKVASTSLASCGTANSLEVPRGMNIQHCLLIENLGNSPLVTITVDAPTLGLEDVTLPNRQIAAGGSYELTFNEVSQLQDTNPDLINGFAQFGVTSGQTTIVTVTGRTRADTPTIDTDASFLTIGDESIEIDLEVRAGNREDECTDTAKSVSSNADVYYCVVLSNLGTFDLTNASISHTETSFSTQNISTLAAGTAFTQTFGSLRITEAKTNTASLRGDVSTQWGTVVITATESRSVGLLPVINEALVPIPSLTPTSPTAGPTATSTRRPPLNTSTPFPSFTPTVTFTPSPRPAPPTHTPVSPLPTPTPTPTPVVLRAVSSPVALPTETSTATATSTSSPTPTATATPARQSLAAALPVPSGSNATETPSSQASSDIENGVDDSSNRDTENAGPLNSPLDSPEGNDDELNRQIENAGSNQTSPLSAPTSTATVTLTPSTISETTIPSTTIPSTTIPSTASTPTPTETGQPTVNPALTLTLAATESPVEATDDSGNNLGGSATEDQQESRQDPLSQPSNSEANRPPSPARLMASRVTESALAAAAWLWFVCGSIIFFGVAGLIAGLYFRDQERNRFALIRDRLGNVSSAQPSVLLGKGNLENTNAPAGEAASPGFQISDSQRSDAERRSKAGSSSTPRAGQDQSDDDHWPTSLP